MFPISSEKAALVPHFGGDNARNNLHPYCIATYYTREDACRSLSYSHLGSGWTEGRKKWLSGID